MLKFGRKFSHQLQPLYIIHGCRRHLLYSTSSASESHPSLQILLVDYLGFPCKKPLSPTKLSRFLEEQEAKKVSDFDFAKNVVSVVDFFKQIGFEQPQIKKVVAYLPRILCANADKSLKPKIKLLQDLGFSGSDLVNAILANPLMLTRRMRPQIDAIRDVVGSDKNVAKVLRRSKWLSFTHAADNHLIPNVKLLQEYGISNDKTVNFMLQQPKVLYRKPDIFRDMLIKVEDKFGIPRDSPTFLPGLYLACYKEESVKGKCDIFKSYGWTHSDVLRLIGLNPYCLGLSETMIKKKLEFLMKELGYKPALLASRSNLMAYSLEKRLLPRHKLLLFLKEKGLLSRDYCLLNIASWNEPKFIEKYIEPFKDVVPDIHQVYRSTSDIPPTP
ncbi:transcription termination factor MTERF2, chloroplastic-like [Chenopodium quinoa]|uniref:Uncharacterized protein n=1 Tax=Chenopodium quinoa TaxID=63459 RepID=A0A803LJZ8_CHEQI|nr:transcription termination factor MTERF2, chloroplastic-like [Chenopodium quinoa]XP_021759690.1 transcription termination factor MTERF2, chloroplastic-like [Chenopodium quinoa]XP_021759691.1 transcription termination factor MTERF2, chloroplastic-like [Chenopodium quinoa]